MPDLLVGDVHRCRGGERLAPTEVAHEPGMRAARHLHADPMPAPEDMRGRPQAHFDVRSAVWLSLPVGRRQAGEPVADVPGLTRRLDVAEPDEEIGALAG